MLKKKKIKINIEIYKYENKVKYIDNYIGNKKKCNEMMINKKKIKNKNLFYGWVV